MVQRQLPLPETRDGPLADPTLKPPLKWAGGKRWLVPHLRPLWEPHRERRLVEPFCGGLAVALGLRPQRALLNDISPHLIAFYRWVRTGLRIEPPLENAVHNREDVYYQNRNRFNELVSGGRIDDEETAVLFYYLNRTGYNGLCRFNRKGGFNVPFGAYKHITYVNDFTPYSAMLRRWDFVCGDFEGLDLEPDDFVYADPPYDVDFTKYAKEDFTWADQERLAHWLRDHPGPVALSNQATERILKLYTAMGFRLLRFDGPRRISCDGDRTPADEVLALKGVE